MENSIQTNRIVKKDYVLNDNISQVDSRYFSCTTTQSVV
jgi:hypothetical protein